MMNGKKPKENPIKRVDILGCPFDAISFEETMCSIRRAILENQKLHIAVGNVDMVMKVRRDSDFAHVFRRADLVIADGVPITWAASLLGEPLRGHVAGTEIAWKCAEVSQEIGCSVAMVGASYEIALRAASNMCKKYQSADLHVVPTPYPLTAEDNIVLVNEIKEKNAKIVLVALGAPMQEKWIQDHLDQIGANVGIGIGSAFDIISGDKPWAPRWMRDNGLEWLFRTMLEPKRIGKRVLEDIPFFGHLFVEWLRLTMMGERYRPNLGKQ